ncbi:MAG: hypothetical protein AMS16_06995 [Planctomycetes bacterium DG_58]|nr:MAG: hypothetical protein AMS16_06995 [Planctomycetes bacterium DG_58]
MRVMLMAGTLVVIGAGFLQAEEVVGYESGLATHMLLAEDRERLAKLPLQDLVDQRKGRYTHIQDDGVMGHWGLDAIRSRQDIGEKPYKLLLTDGVYQTERVIFPDLGTGVTMMKLSDTPYGEAGDELFYFGKACWNADGSVMTWMRSRKAGLWGPAAQKGDDVYGVLLSDGDGTRPRIAFQDAGTVKVPICHPTDPGLAYSVSEEGLIELDLRTGTKRRVVKEGLRAWWLKLSPDGRYAGSTSYRGGKFWVVELKTGKMWTFPLETRIHDSYRFVPGDTDWIMFWYEGGRFRTEGIVCTNFKTGRTVTSKVRFDWNHGDVGRFLGVHCSPYITEWNGTTKQWGPMKSLKQFGPRFTDSAPDYANPVRAGGYLQHWPDDQLWAYPTRYTARPWLSEVQCIFAKPFAKGYGRVNYFRICFSNHRRETDRKGAKSIVLSRPNISFDGTKLLHNSNVFGRCEVLMTVLRKPLPPRDLKGVWKGPAVELSWTTPKYHQEIRGYHVYRSSESGRGFTQITDGPVAGTSFVDARPNGRGWTFYAVRSVEHSKLESGLSAEAMVVPLVNMPVPAPPLRIFAEAEEAVPADLRAPSPDAIWVNVSGTASNLYYIWQRRADEPGKVTLRVNVPRAGDYTVIARMKGKDGAAFTVAGQSLEAAPGDAWQWVRSPGTVKLAAGERTITIESSKHGSCLDCFYLSTDANFEPKGRIVTTTPDKPTLDATSVGGYPKLSWQGAKDERFHYYNLYCSRQAGFTPGRATLIASPDGTEFLDWQTLPGRNYYRVTQVTLDGLESAPSNEVSVQK